MYSVVGCVILVVQFHLSQTGCPGQVSVSGMVARSRTTSLVSCLEMGDVSSPLSFKCVHSLLEQDQHVGLLNLSDKPLFLWLYPFTS
jgi:hypothetical protein